VPGDDAGKKIFDKIAGQHGPGGEPLLQFGPGGKPKTTFYEPPKAATKEAGEAATEATAKELGEKGAKEGGQVLGETGAKEGGETAAEAGAKGDLPKEPGAGGHEVKVTNAGDIIVCSKCEKLSSKYAPELDADPKLAQQLADLQDLERLGLEAKEVAKEAAELQKKLHAARIAATKGPLSAAQAKELADDLGFLKTNQRSKGQAVYRMDNKYVVRDVDGHNGGVWKMADSPAALGSKTTRSGTYNADLSVRIGD